MGRCLCRCVCVCSVDRVWKEVSCADQSAKVAKKDGSDAAIKKRERDRFFSGDKELPSESLSKQKRRRKKNGSWIFDFKSVSSVRRQSHPCTATGFVFVVISCVLILKREKDAHRRVGSPVLRRQNSINTHTPTPSHRPSDRRVSIFGPLDRRRMFWLEAIGCLFPFLLLLAEQRN